MMAGDEVIKRLKAKGKKMQKEEAASKKPVDKDTESE